MNYDDHRKIYHRGRHCGGSQSCGEGANDAKAATHVLTRQEMRDECRRVHRECARLQLPQRLHRRIAHARLLVLEALAGDFSMKVVDMLNRLNALEQMGHLTAAVAAARVSR